MQAVKLSRAFDHCQQVDTKGTMLNIFVDGSGEPQYVPVGNIADIRSFEPSSIAGVPIAELEKAYGGRQKTLYAFPNEDGVALPDNAPATIAKVGRMCRLQKLMRRWHKSSMPCHLMMHHACMLRS